jgi:hypothetical protein
MKKLLALTALSAIYLNASALGYDSYIDAGVGIRLDGTELNQESFDKYNGSKFSDVSLMVGYKLSDKYRVEIHYESNLEAMIAGEKTQYNLGARAVRRFHLKEFELCNSYADIGAGFRIDATEIEKESFDEYNDSKFPTAYMAVGCSLNGYSVELHHESNYLIGKPFNEDKEQHYTGLRVIKHF